jgi:hypothetical protein
MWAILRLFTLFFIFVFSAGYGYAQDLNIPDDILVTEFDDVPDAYIIEAGQFEDYCDAKVNLRRHYDCECLAAAFLEERIEEGPQEPRGIIMSNIQDRCHDATEAAGYQYNFCLTSGPVVPEGLTSSEYCGCYARSYVELFEQIRMDITPMAVTRLQTEAYRRCSTMDVEEEMFKRLQ